MFIQIRHVITKHKESFFFAVFIGLLTYMYMMTNKLPNWDEVAAMFSKGTTITSGRWGLEYTDRLFPNFSLPWLWGCVSICIVGITACLIIEIFEIHNKALKLILAGLMVSFPSLVSTFAYMFTLPSDALGLFLSVFAAYMAICSKDPIVKTVVPCASLILSMSIYQAYLPVSVSLFIIYIIQRLLMGEPDHIRCDIDFFRFMAIIAVSCGAYFWITKLVLAYYHTSFNSTAQGALDFKGIPFNIVSAYLHFIAFFITQSASLVTTPLSQIVHIILILCILWSLAAVLKKKKSVLISVLVIGLLSLFPLGVNMLFLFIKPQSIGTMESYGFFTFYVLVAVIIDLQLDNLSYEGFRKISVYGLAVVLIVNVYVANRCWLQMQFALENLRAVYTAVVTQINMTPGFDENSIIVFVGELPENKTLSPFSEEAQLEGVPYSMLNIYSRRNYLNRYLDYNIPIVDRKTVQEEGMRDLINEMNCYPYYGYIQKYDKYIIVKLGNG